MRRGRQGPPAAWGLDGADGSGLLAVRFFFLAGLARRLGLLAELDDEVFDGHGVWQAVDQVRGFGAADGRDRDVAEVEDSLEERLLDEQPNRRV